MARKARICECHPDRKHLSFGLCGECYRKKHYKEHTEVYAAYRKERTSVNNRAAHLMSRYGITVVEYAAMFTAQEGVCLICKRPPKKRPLHVDHDHKTGKIRGLLCFRCNYGLSWFGHNSQTLQNASQYIENK
jgi:hypothetical protein